MSCVHIGCYGRWMRGKCMDGRRWKTGSHLGSIWPSRNQSFLQPHYGDSGLSPSATRRKNHGVICSGNTDQALLKRLENTYHFTTEHLHVCPFFGQQEKTIGYGNKYNRWIAILLLQLHSNQKKSPVHTSLTGFKKQDVEPLHLLGRVCQCSAQSKNSQPTWSAQYVDNAAYGGWWTCTRRSALGLAQPPPRETQHVYLALIIVPLISPERFNDTSPSLCVKCYARSCHDHFKGWNYRAKLRRDGMGSSRTRKSICICIRARSYLSMSVSIKSLNRSEVMPFALYGPTRRCEGLLCRHRQPWFMSSIYDHMYGYNIKFKRMLLQQSTLMVQHAPKSLIERQPERCRLLTTLKDQAGVGVVINTSLICMKSPSYVHQTNRFAQQRKQLLMPFGLESSYFFSNSFFWCLCIRLQYLCGWQDPALQHGALSTSTGLKLVFPATEYHLAC